MQISFVNLPFKTLLRLPIAFRMKTKFLNKIVLDLAPASLASLSSSVPFCPICSLLSSQDFFQLFTPVMLSPPSLEGLYTLFSLPRIFLTLSFYFHLLFRFQLKHHFHEENLPDPLSLPQSTPCHYRLSQGSIYILRVPCVRNDMFLCIIIWSISNPSFIFPWGPSSPRRNPFSDQCILSA